MFNWRVILRESLFRDPLQKWGSGQSSHSVTRVTDEFTHPGDADYRAGRHSGDSAFTRTTPKFTHGFRGRTLNISGGLRGAREYTKMDTMPLPSASIAKTLGEPRGLIFNIMKFALHDGPGTRTTVFFKGCPLCCWWCHNPEGLSAKPELMFFEKRCVVCGECLKVCPHGAIVQEDGGFRTTEACHACGTCVDACYAGARELAGRWVTVQEVIHEVEKDRVFWEESGGGVTFSGGEPLFQAHFLEPLLDSCRARKIHTAVETCGLARHDVMRRLAAKVDLFLFDLKVLDPDKHRLHTGRGNKSILANLEALARMGANVIVRFPVIPGVNTDRNNVGHMITLLDSLKLRRIHFLPFHSIGTEKYRRLGLSSQGIEDKGSPESVAEGLAREFAHHGFDVKVGG